MHNNALNTNLLEQLRPPYQIDHTSLPFQPTVDGVNAWLQGLPILNASVIGEHLEIATNALLSNDLEIIKKFNLLETITPSLYVFFDECVKDVLDAKFPLRNSLNLLTENLIAVLNNFIQIYVGVIKSDVFFTATTNKESKLKTTFDNKQRALVLHRALSMLGLLQLFSSVTYRHSAINAWGEVNALYCIARDNTLDQSPTKLEQQCQYASANILDEFIKINYLHLSLLNRFRQRDILKIHNIINKQSPDICISKEKTEHSSFFIDINTNNEIANISSYTEPSSGTCFFGNTKLIQYFATLALAKDKRLSLDNIIIQKLLPCWQQSHARQFSRNEQTKKILIYPGFKNIINKLSPNDTPSVLVGKKTTAPSKNSFGLSNVEIVPIDNGSFAKHSMRSEKDFVRAIKENHSTSINAVEIWSSNTEPKKNQSPQQVDAIQKNTSATGVMFTVAAENKPVLQAADLIGIDTGESNIELAIIRRLDNLKKEGISLGVELIAPSVKLAVICNTDKSIRSREVLFLPGIPRINQADAIICLSLLENPRIDLELKINNQITLYRITKLIETNSVFTRYTLLKIAKEG